MSPGPVLVFSGQGSQWPGMARELLDDPPFAEAVAVVEPVFRAELGLSPAAALAEGDLGGADRIQALLYAVHLGLAGMLRARGVRPGAVIGHSVGEIAAAVVAGALSARDGARLSCRRSLLLRRAVGGGAMALVTLPFAEAAARLRGRPDLVAAIDSAPASCVVSGTPAAVAALAGQWPDAGVYPVASDVAFHSPQMDALLPDLVAAVADLVPSPCRTPVYSTTLPDPRAALVADGTYWAANLRRPVRLTRAVTAAVEDGHRDFVEVAPHPVVAESIRRTLAALGVAPGVVAAVQRRHRPQLPTFLSAITPWRTEQCA
ncbi:acyltransferase domain-containing protein [Actinocorallia sp. API 0066]|uniref:acyltransferase domain-containing protein n=1 Tax=Actinocorallia sp. API 0066 TaxID=2896846 RepID=UPI001E32892A|nr:acyltransferase domain-containing protein [Actinocorallia sp. API 0066]MCD0452408.1 acyltransferase domain-containing protein [Actinocorallia sp. API 0066]